MNLRQLSAAEQKTTKSKFFHHNKNQAKTTKSKFFPHNKNKAKKYTFQSLILVKL